MIQKKARGYENAFNELYERYSFKLFNHCRFITFSEVDAEEVFQQTWMKFLEAAIDEKGMKNIKAYLIQTSNNIFKNLIRDKRSTISLNEAGILIADKEFYADLQTSLEQTDLYEIIKHNVNQLDEKYRTAFIMNKFEGFSCQEIADTLGISYDNAKKRLKRANDQLMHLLEPYIKEFSD
jgi:RNA polymerase sigma-70 factor (ECF subfamily)